MSYIMYSGKAYISSTNNVIYKAQHYRVHTCMSAGIEEYSVPTVAVDPLSVRDLKVNVITKQKRTHYNNPL